MTKLRGFPTVERMQEIKVVKPKTVRTVKEPKARFSEYQSQLMYEDALSKHDFLMESPLGDGLAYRKGYDGREEMPKGNYMYPIFCAGKDNRHKGL